MCGIIGYIGKQEALPILIDGLYRLEYRGYDSSGLVIVSQGAVSVAKAVGRISQLDDKVSADGIRGKAGIAHTRWATHGAPEEKNSHPHSDCQGNIWVVHNGIVENHGQLRDRLISKGHKFISDTDTEVIAHLLEEQYGGDLGEALRKVLDMIKGTYGLAVIHKNEPDKIVVAKEGSPLVIGIGEGEIFVSSDVSAILKHTRQIVYLEDGEMAEITGGSWKISEKGAVRAKQAQTIEWDVEAAEKSGYPHFMLKEIFEQPKTVADSIRGRLIPDEGRVKLGGLEVVADKLRGIDRLIISACGTARNSGLIGEYMLEEYAGLPTEVDYASEFRYREQAIGPRTGFLAVSQSGETADTLAAVKEAKEKGILTLGLVNVVGSSIARSTDAGAYNHIGPEIAVASTKAFTSQLALLALMTVFLGRQRKMSLVTGQRIISELEKLPEKIERILADSGRIKEIASRYSAFKNFAYLGRKYNYPLAQEGALKLKELSYIHAEGFASGEMKHGAIAMIDKDFPTMFICPKDSVYGKNLSNMAEIKARNGKVIAIATEGDDRIRGVADEVVYIPKTMEMLTPILAAVPLQLFAYHIAVAKGLDVDKPRNLAKSVTVE